LRQHTVPTDQPDETARQNHGQEKETDEQENQQGSDREQSAPSRTAAEWVVFAVSALVLAAVVTVITADALGTRRPPAFITTVGTVAERNGAHYVTVAVENEGDTTAASVRVDARLLQDGEVVEQATQTLDFLAGDERRQVRFVVERDPRALELQAVVSSFQVP
jgi:uncharacterized protein (TIGR02588 family)